MPSRLRRAFEVLRGQFDPDEGSTTPDGTHPDATPPTDPGEPAPIDADGVAAVNPRYLTEAPSAQTQLDLFAGEWTSGVPVPGEQTTSGPRPDLFDDERIAWAIEQLGPIAGWDVLELGPLEAGHTTMLERAGATVTAVEAHTHAFLRCLVVKNLLALEARFELGDFVPYLRATDRHWDCCVASGVLYHMTDPVELLHLIGAHCDRLALWTHYYDDEIMARRPDVAARFAGTTTLSAGDFGATGHRYEYREGPAQATFCGGSRPHAFWLSRADLFATLAAAGFGEPTVQFDDPDYPHGPSISLVASRG